MMIAMHIGVKLERICKIGADRAVRAAGYSPKQPDASSRRAACAPPPMPPQMRTSTFASAKEACERTMALPVGIHNLLIDHLTIFNIINFKLGGVAKMLKYISVFIGNCDSHLIGSFLLHRLLQGCAACFCASFLATGNAAVAKPVMTACNSKRLSINNAVCDFRPCGFVYFGHGSSGDVHLLTALLMGKLLQINEAESLHIRPPSGS